jgi:pilus assembly protein CpaB
MNRRTGKIIFAAFLVACLCTFAVWRIISVRLNSSNFRRGSTIVAASAPIKIGAVLTAADVKTVEIVGELPEGAIQDPKKALGRGVLASLYSGEPILEGRLAPLGSGGGLAATIPSGMRVCAVKVDEVVGVAGFVTPGMRVDVLISGIPPGALTASTEGPQVRTLLQNIEVKSAGTDIERDGQGKPQQVQVVNLLVTPEQAESLSLASGQTRIQLVLRNPLDTQVAAVNGNTMGRLFTRVGAASPSPLVLPRKAQRSSPEFYSVEVLNGSKGSTARFAVSGENK